MPLFIALNSNEIWKHCKNAIPLHLFHASYDSTLRFFPQLGPFVAPVVRPSRSTTLSRETSIKQLKAETTKATMRWPMRWCSKYGENALSIAMALESIPQLKLLSCGETESKMETKGSISMAVNQMTITLTWFSHMNALQLEALKLFRAKQLLQGRRQAAQIRNWHFELQFFQYSLCYFTGCWVLQIFFPSKSLEISLSTRTTPQRGIPGNYCPTFMVSASEGLCKLCTK